MGLSCVQRWSNTQGTVSSKVEKADQAHELNSRLLKFERKKQACLVDDIAIWPTMHMRMYVWVVYVYIMYKYVCDSDTPQMHNVGTYV